MQATVNRLFIVGECAISCYDQSRGKASAVNMGDLYSTFARAV